MRVTVRSIYQKIIYLFFPAYCIQCLCLVATHLLLCAACTERMQRPIPLRLSITQTYSVWLYAASLYVDPLRKLIRAKHHRMIQASWQLGRLVAESAAIDGLGIEVCIPVPLHWSRNIMRGYNQAHEMAVIIARKKEARVVHAVTRVRYTQLQASLNKQDRFDNIDGVFAATKKAAAITGKHVAIIDDLVTTGATVKEMVRVLRVYKPASIVVIVACRGT